MSMSIISKQWAKSQGSVMWDFDILEEANNILPEHLIPVKCDGYGFIAIAKDEYGGIHLAFPDPAGTDDINWVDYTEIVK